MSLLDLANRIKSSLSDDEGWFQRGKFTPKKYLTPTSNKGQNFWSTPTAQKLASVQRTTQPLVQRTATRLKQAVPALGRSMAFSNPFISNRQLRTYGVDPSDTQARFKDIKTGAKGALTTYGLANPAIALKSTLGGAGINTLFKIGSNVAQKQPVFKGTKEAAFEGGGAGLANAGTTRLTQGLVERFAKYIPVLKPLTDKALKTAKPDTLKQGIKLWADVAGRKFIKAAVVETLVETPIWATLTQTDKESYVEAIKREAVENLVLNVGFAGVDVLGDVAKLTPLVQKSIKQSVDSYVAKASSPEGLQAQAGKVDLGAKIEETTFAKIERPKELVPEAPTSKVPQIEDISLKSSDQIITEAGKEIGTIQEPKKTIRQSANELYTNWVNRFEPIERLAKKIEAEQKISILPSKSPVYTTRQLLGAGGTAELRHKQSLQPILDQIDSVAPVKDMDIYLKAKRDIGFSEVGRTVKGSDPIKAQATIDALGTKYDLNQLDDVAKKLYTYQDEGLNKLLESGFIDQKGYDAIKAGNKYYVPFQRVMDTVDNYLGVPTRTAQAGQVIKKIKGSERQILSPIESVIADTYKIESAVAKNRVASSVIGLKDIAPEYAFSKAQKASGSTVSVWENGKKVHYEVGKEIADVLKGVNEESAGMLVKILSAPARLLRQGATGRNIDFMIPNVFKDQLDAAVTSKYGYKPFLDYFRGLGHLMNYKKTGSDELVESWMQSGGKIFFENMSGRKGIKEQIEGATQKKGLAKQLRDWAIGGIDVVGEYSEVPTRLGLYKKALKKTGNPLLAMMESREGTLDFARMGAKMKTANSIIPFLNVGVQGFDKLIRAIKSDPKKVGLRFAVYAGIPAIMTSLYNNLFHREEINEVPTWVKDSNFVFVKGRTKDGKVDYAKFPKGNVVPYVANPTEELIAWMAGNDPRGFKEMATSLLSEGLPVIKGGSNLKEVGVRTLGGILPQAIKPAFEDLLNKSTFRTTAEGEPKEIVPYYLKDKPPPQQSYKHTPGAYKAIGKILNVSPLRAKNFLEGTFAGAFKTPVGILETLDKVTKGEKVDPNIIPVLRRFYGETYQTTKKTTTKKDSGRFDAQAAEPLPDDLKSIKILYEDAVKTVEGYGEKKIKIKHGISSADLDELQGDVDNAIKIRKEIEKEKPEMIFKIGLDSYKSGGGMLVTQRAEWAKGQLEGKTGEEFNKVVDEMLKSKVLTKSVTEALREAGIKINKYTSGGKTKTLGGSGKSKKFKSITIKKVGKLPNIKTAKFGTRRPPTFKIKTPPKIRMSKVGKIKLPTYKTPNIKVAKIQGLQPGIKLV